MKSSEQLFTMPVEVLLMKSNFLIILDINSIFGSTATPTSTPTSTFSPSQMVDCYYDGQINLLTVNATTTTNRNLESFTEYFFVPLVCLNGRLGYICDRGWNNDAAYPICRQGSRYPYSEFKIFHELG